MSAKRLTPGSKRESVLRELLQRGARGLNRFEAERACADHVLPSTISELCRDFGLAIPRTLETVPGYGGKATECSRYALSDADAIKARAILEAADARLGAWEAAGRAQAAGAAS